MPIAKKALPMIGTIQWMLLPLVQANQKRPTGMKAEPTIAMGRRASGGAMPPFASATFAYLLFSNMEYATANTIPTVIPRKARPASPGPHPLDAWNTMGNAGNIMYSVPYKIAM